MEAAQRSLFCRIGISSIKTWLRNPKQHMTLWDSASTCIPKNVHGDRDLDVSNEILCCDMGATMQGGPGPAVMCSSSKFGELLGYRIFTSEMATRTASQNPMRCVPQRFDYTFSDVTNLAGTKMIIRSKSNLGKWTRVSLSLSGIYAGVLEKKKKWKKC